MRRATAAITFAIATLAAGALAAPASADLATGDRLEGLDRYDTANEIARDRFDHDEPGVDTIYLASGEGFADALSAGPAAAHNDGPVLLTRRDELPEVTRTAIAFFAPTTVVIVGGPQAVSEAVATEVENLYDGISTVRVAGDDRYETSAAVTSDEATGFAGPVPVLYVTTGEAFPDALAGGAAAAVAGGPVLLVKKDGVPEAVEDEIDRLEPGRIVVLGGSAVIDDDVVTALEAHSDDVDRVFGADRHATSAAVSADRFPDGADRAYLATGAAFPDALAGAPAAAQSPQGPVMLVQATCIPSSVLDELERLDAENGETALELVVLGGIAAVTPAVDNAKLECS